MWHNTADAETSPLTQLLLDWSRGDQSALDQITPQVYNSLHSLARTYLNRGRPNQTLQPTALISELYVRLIGQERPIQWESRAHFFGIAARLMRLVLVDHAREHQAAKRGGGAGPITLKDAMAGTPGPTPDLLELNEALDRLAEFDHRKAEVVEMRYFGGMRREEIATALGLTVPTVKRDLRLAEAWLRRYLSGGAV